MHAKLRKKQYSKAKNQEKSQKLIIFYKKNNILYLFLRNLDFFVNFAGKVQYNTLLGMKIQEVMKLQRKALGITQQDLADMSEIAISTIKKIESGKGNPSSRFTTRHRPMVLVLIWGHNTAAVSSIVMNLRSRQPNM